MKNQGFPDWFNGTIYETGDKVKNPFTQESIDLSAIELSMYDFIMGAQMLINMKGGVFSSNTQNEQKLMQKGLEWFKETNPEVRLLRTGRRPTPAHCMDNDSPRRCQVYYFHNPSVGEASIISFKTPKRFARIYTSDLRRSAIGLISTPPSPYFV